MPKGPGIVDLSYEGRALNDYVDGEDDEEETSHDEGPPEGWVVVGDQLLPEEIVLGLKAVDPEPNYAWEDVPGNKYPRKHTVYLNFDGGPLQGGADNSAENKSILSNYTDHPGSGWGSQTRASVAQGMQADMSRYGIRLVYQERPSKIVPYTMVMFGSNACAVTNAEDCGGIGGVAPGGDCEAHGQRHVVYSFNNGSNTPSHEAGHVFGLDHTTNCSALMSYCGAGDKVFSTTCDGLCEEACQGPGTIGCRPVHEKHCGEGSNRQNDDIELTFIFGGNEPDTEAPFVNILSPEDGLEVDSDGDVDLRAEVSDNYGGVGWKIIIEHDGEVVYDQVDYHKDNIDADAHVALNLVRPEPGSYVITVRAEDHADHITDDTVTFTAVPGGGDGGGDDGGDDGTGDGGDDGGDGGTGDGSGDDGGDGGDDGGDGGDDGDGGGDIGPWDDGRGDEKGCGCSTNAGPEGTAGLLLGLWVLALRRRRA
jgi:uncharacterized protein (TIGR03382 family)